MNETKSCRLVKDHSHFTLPADTIEAVTAAREKCPPCFHVLRVRWITQARKWEVCYAMGAPFYFSDL